jgi:hypothetical protein
MPTQALCVVKHIIANQDIHECSHIVQYVGTVSYHCWYAVPTWAENQHKRRQQCVCVRRLHTLLTQGCRMGAGWRMVCGVSGKII